MTDPMPPDLPDRIITTLHEHAHYFRHIEGTWRCDCGEIDHTRCTPDQGCFECVADFARVRSYVDPYAAIAASPPGNPDCRCGGLGTVSCGACWATGEGPWGAACHECGGGEKPCPKCGVRA